MKHENERVALQAVEFWSTVCEEEIDLEGLREDVCAVALFLLREWMM